MKYEPVAPVGKNFFERLMQPFSTDEAETDWELVDIVAAVFDKLDADDKEVLYEVFYARATYEETAENIGIKAKSHAWRKTQRALGNLRNLLVADDTFRRKYGTKYME
jgi:DNA-directed RNA polymerase specialized sigma24 family protein